MGRPKGPNSRPDKGFMREMQSRPQVPAKGKDGFTWNKPVVKPAEIQTYATTHRLENNRAVRPKTNGFTSETASHKERMQPGRVKLNPPTKKD